MERRARGVAALLVPLVLAALLPALAGAQSAPPTPPPTPVVLPNGSTSPSPFPTVLHTPEPSRRPPEIGAKTAILADLDTGQVLYALNPDQQRAIASVTKIMTALLVLERTDPNDMVTVSPNAAGDGRTAGISELGLQAGERISVNELLYALLLQSASDAAIALAEHVGGSVDAFVAEMNRRAQRLGLVNTEFFSPSGLDDRGHSSARDLVTITQAAYRRPGFASIVATKFHEIPAPEGEPSRIVQNRNVLLWLYPGAMGVKTGFTTKAGYCVVATAGRDGQRLIAVVLGEPGEPFSDAAALLNYGFTAFEHVGLLEEGESLGAVVIDGHEVPVVAGGALQGLLPSGAEPTRSIELDPSAAFPPLPGEAVGTLTVRIPEMRVGAVPVVVASVPPPPPPTEPGPWWRRALGSLFGAVDGLLDQLFD